MSAFQVFCSFASEDRQGMEKFRNHLADLTQGGIITVWDQASVPPGTNKQAMQDSQLAAADMILFLVSASFLASTECMREVDMAMALHQQKGTSVIPILFSSVHWQYAPFSSLQPLPSTGEPISNWSDEDSAFTNVVEGIAKEIERLQATSPQNFTQGEHRQLSQQPLKQALLEHFMRFTFRPKVRQFEEQKVQHKRQWQRQQTITGILGTLTCLSAVAALLTFNFLSILHLIFVFCMGLLSATTLIYLFFLRDLYSYERWLFYRGGTSELKNEQRLYENKLGIYGMVADRESVFKSRIFDIIRETESGTRSSHHTSDYLSTNTHTES